MSFHYLMDRLLVWYFHKFRHTRPFAPILVDDLLPLMKLGPEDFFVKRPRGLWSPTHLAFPTPRPLPWADEAVNTAYISPLFVHQNNAQDAVLWVHGFLMDDPMVWNNARRGIIAIARAIPAAHYMLHLPLHFERKQTWKGKKVGVEWSFQTSPFRLLEVIALGVNEAREFIYWWLNNRAGKVVVAGISLGGNVAGWIPVLEEDGRLGAALFVPALDLPQILDASPLVRPLREGFIGDFEAVKRYMRLWSPITRPLTMPGERVRIMAGKEDGILPSSQMLQGLVAGGECARRQLQAWVDVCVQALPGGHSSWALGPLGAKDRALFAQAISELL